MAKVVSMVAQPEQSELSEEAQELENAALGWVTTMIYHENNYHDNRYYHDIILLD